MTLTDKKLLAEFAQLKFCELCRRPAIDLETHHAASFRGMGGATRLDIRWNLIRLCGRFTNDCHDKAQRGTSGYRKADICAVIAKREGCQADDIVNAVYVVRRFRNDATDAVIERQLDGQSEAVKRLVWNLVEKVRAAE